MRSLLLIPLFLFGCQPRWLDSDLANLRAEIAEIEKEMPPQEPLWVHEGPHSFNAILEDGPSRIPSHIYNHVASKLEKLPEAELASITEKSFDLSKLVADPASHRGRVYGVQGVIAKLTPMPITDGNQPAKTTYYSGAVWSGNRPILFHSVTKPDMVWIGQDSVEFRGLFVKMITYTARNGESVQAPFFMCKSVRKYY